MTMIMVSKDDLETVATACEFLNEAIYMGAVPEEMAGIVETDLTKFRSRIAIALGVK
jgi:hypothetical protein